MDSQDPFERYFDWVVGGASGRVIVALPLLFYPGIGLIVHLGFGRTIINLVSINVFGVMVAVLLLVGWLGVSQHAMSTTRLLRAVAPARVHRRTVEGYAATGYVTWDRLAEICGRFLWPS